MIKIVVYLLLLVVIFIPVAVHAKDLKKGMSFLAARKLLIHKGWNPINVHDGMNFPYIGIDKTLIIAHIEEVEACAMDRAVCIFNYKKGEKCFRLFTQGEEIKDMRVTYWTNDCPDEQ